jgi:hypothetical protein
LDDHEGYSGVGVGWEGGVGCDFLI